MRFVVGFVCFLMLPAGFAGAQTAFADVAEATAKACVHYGGRAHFKSRTEAVEFVTVLADACAGAQATLLDPEAPVARKAAAATFLERLQGARAAIGAIDAERFAAARDKPRKGGTMVDLRASRGLVTLSGEFLILRRAGVLAALEEWVAAGADFGLLAALR